MAKSDLTAQRLRELLHYDPETGVFVWQVTPTSYRVKVGDVAGSINNKGYIQIAVGGYAYMAHRLAWLWVNWAWPKFWIDHINGDPSDNRIANLRDVTSGVNQENRNTAQSNSVSGALGVSRNGKGWAARINVSRDVIRLGTYASIEEAHAAYVAAKRLLHKGCTI